MQAVMELELNQNCYPSYSSISPLQTLFIATKMLIQEIQNVVT